MEGELLLRGECSLNPWGHSQALGILSGVFQAFTLLWLGGGGEVTGKDVGDVVDTVLPLTE